MSRAVPLLLLAALVAACGGDPVGVSKTKLTFGGVFAGDNGTEAGNFGVTIVVEDGTGTGSFVVNGAAHSITSLTYDGTNVVASGAGYVFTGTTLGDTVSGTYTSTSGGGLFVGLKKAGTTALTSYCGTHIGTNNGVPLAGAFAFVESGTARRGVVTSVLSDPFRGYLRTVGSTTEVVGLTGNLALVVAGGGNFVGQYTMASGEIGDAEGSVCRASVSSPILSLLDGVLGSYDGVIRGNLTFSLSSTGLGSTGSYTVGGVVHDFQAVISGVGSEIAAFDTDFRVIVTQNADEASGTYASGGSVAGAVATLLRGTGQTNELYCGMHDASSGSGAFSFIVRSDNVLFGLYTGGVGSIFQGLISGSPGDNTSTMSTQGDPVTILPNPDGSFGGFWDWSTLGHSNTSSATVSGAAGACST
jgi:hypothetical protein